MIGVDNSFIMLSSWDPVLQNTTQDEAFETVLL
jgi:hypothetical protein